MTKKIVVVMTMLVLCVFALTAQTVDDDGTILKFSTMAGVTGPYVGPTNPIRGVPAVSLQTVVQGEESQL